MKNLLFKTTVIALVGLTAIFFYFYKSSENKKEEIPFAKVERRSFAVDIQTIGELEAARSTIIASSIRGDQGKIIYLIPDGKNVKPDDILVRMDPTPFEEKIEDLRVQVSEQVSYLETLQKTIEWETNQAEHEIKTAAYEAETAELELNKVIHGDGPLEVSRLKAAMQKAWLKYDELNGYSADLLDLEQQGFLNPTELRQAQKKLAEEAEAYEVAKMQHDSYVNHVHPMQIKKAETAVKKAKIKQEEVAKTGGYKIGKSMALIAQAEEALNDLKNQLKESKKELALTEIKAPAPGMVVHREDYRSGQRRKPRLGDILVKNQALMDLPDLDSMTVKTKVREVDLYKIGVGKLSTIRVDAYPQLVFTGHVQSIGVLALTDIGRLSEEKYFEVRIALDKSDHRLRPGMTTHSTLHANQIDDALTVPVHAVFDQGQETYCYVHKPEGYQKRPIQLGNSNEQWVEVKEGLEEGESVCLIDPFVKEESW